MRSYDPNDDDDRKELAKLNAEPWMVELLDLNPEYVHWGPGEDYMPSETSDKGWETGMLFRSGKVHNLELNHLNEVVNFYFGIRRDNHPCPHCRHGWTKEADAMEFYSQHFVPRDDQLQVLHENKRLRVPDRDAGYATEELRRFWNQEHPAMRIDAINRSILVEHECKRLGIPAICAVCKGDGIIYEEEPGFLVLTYWLIHPRKGASRGVRVERIQQEDLPAIFKFLSEAATRNAQRFEKVVAKTKETP